jgi:hypothetical protein
MLESDGAKPRLLAFGDRFWEGILPGKLGSLAPCSLLSRLNADN